MDGFFGKTIVFLAATLVGLFAATSAPAQFPRDSLVRISDGATLSRVAEGFEENHVVRSPVVLRALVTLFAGDGGVKAGDYFFSGPQSALRIALRIATGSYGLDPVRVTVPEGSTVAEIGDILESAFHGFSAEDFVFLAGGKEGYLFPDTYFFLPNISPREAISAMESNFTRKIADLEEDINAFDASLKDIVIMASLIEEEVRTPQDKEIVSGILWKRLERGMPLQVDAPFYYILGKGSAELTLDDLAVDSPYNTYRFQGLPPSPISNPGLESLRAAVNPTETLNFFFLSDRNGNTHYARTFEEHVANKRRYLD